MMHAFTNGTKIYTPGTKTSGCKNIPLGKRPAVDVLYKKEDGIIRHAIKQTDVANCTDDLYQHKY